MKTELAKHLQWHPADRFSPYPIHCDKQAAAEVVSQWIEETVEDVLAYTKPIEWIMAAMDQDTDAAIAKLKDKIKSKYAYLPYSPDFMEEAKAVLLSFWSHFEDSGVEDRRTIG